jgi:hypothetical protein
MNEDDEVDDGTEQVTVSRRAYLAGGVTALSAGAAGCMTTGLQLETDGVDASEIFDSFSLSESWTASNATAVVTLTQRAARTANVRELSVVAADGSSIWSGDVEPGQTSVSNVLLPTGEAATVVAADGSENFVDAVTVRVAGSTVP